MDNHSLNDTNYYKPLYFLCKNNSSSSYPLYGAYLQNWLIVGLANVILSPVTFSMNLITLTALRRATDKNTLTNYIFTALCTTDMLTGLIAQVLFGALYLKLFYKKASCSLLFASTGSGYFFVAISFLTLLAIHVERYSAVFHPFTFVKIAADTRLIKKMIFFSWVMIAILVAVSSFTPQFVMFRFIASILVPTGFIWSCFVQVKIVRQVHKITKNLRKIAPQTDDNSERERYLSRLKSRSNKIAGLVLLAYLICYTPTIIIYIWRYINQKSQLLLAVRAWTETLVFLNSIFNPLLFYLQKKDIRKTVWSLIRYLSPFSRIYQESKEEDHTRATSDVEVK